MHRLSHVCPDSKIWFPLPLIPLLAAAIWMIGITLRPIWYDEAFAILGLMLNRESQSFDLQKGRLTEQTIDEDA